MNSEIITQFVNAVNSNGRFLTDNEIIENALWFNLAAYIGILQPKIEINNKVVPLNYFGLTIAGSSSGKDFANNQIKKFLHVDTGKYVKAFQTGYKKANEEIDDELFASVDGEKVPLENFINDMFINISGTEEGLYMRALALANSFSGSLNIINEEFLDTAGNDFMMKTKELYDGVYNAKIIKGQINRNIKNIIVNMLLFGSSIALKKDRAVHNHITKVLTSGIYRRSFIYYKEPSQIIRQKNKIAYDNSVIDFAIDNITNFINKHIKNTIEGKQLTIKIPDNDKFLDIEDELLEFANKHIDDEKYSAEIGSFDKIVKLSALHSIISGRDSVSDDDIDYAYSFYRRCRDTTEKLFNTEPQFKRIYKIIKKESLNGNKIFLAEILQKDVFTKSGLEDDFKMVEELCYISNEQLVVSGSKIKQYRIEPLPVTDINKLIVGISIDPKAKQFGKIFKNLEIPLFGDSMCFESLVKSEYIYMLCHTDEKGKKESNLISGQNVIAFDFDDTCSINDVTNKVVQYTYLLYTTKSHTDNNHRFRIIFPLYTKIFVTPEQHKKMMENISNFLDFPPYDIACRNMGRNWFGNTNDDIKIIKNTPLDENGKLSLLDARCCIPDTNMEEDIGNVLSNIEIDESKIDIRIKGMIKWALSNSVATGRNQALYRFYKFACDILGDKDEAKDNTYYVNSLLPEPLPLNEIKKMK